MAAEAKETKTKIVKSLLCKFLAIHLCLDSYPPSIENNDIEQVSFYNNFNK